MPWRGRATGSRHLSGGCREAVISPRLQVVLWLLLLLAALGLSGYAGFWFCMMLGFGGWGMLASAAFLQFFLPALALDIVCALWGRSLYRRLR